MGHQFQNKVKRFSCVHRQQDGEGDAGQLHLLHKRLPNLAFPSSSPQVVVVVSEVVVVLLEVVVVLSEVVVVISEVVVVLSEVAVVGAVL